MPLDDSAFDSRARGLLWLLCDVDGVLTDGRLYYGPQGEAMKAFDVRDGHGIKLLREGGVDVAILTARRSEIVAVRARELGVERVLQGQADKVAGLAQLCAETGLAGERCGYIGDDWPDLAVFARVLVDVFTVPGVQRHIGLQVGSVPARGAGRGAFQCRQSLVATGKMPDIELVHLQRLLKVTDLYRCGLTLGPTQLI